MFARAQPWRPSSPPPPGSQGSSTGSSSSSPSRRRPGLSTSNINVSATASANDSGIYGPSDWQDKFALRDARERRKESSVRVLARFRPVPCDSIGVEGELAFRVRPDGVSVDAVDGGHTFVLNHAFGPDSSQEHVYDIAGRPMIEDVLEGYNGTIFAYGPTGSGKTHCMFGPPGLELGFRSDRQGVVPRAAWHVFDRIRAGADDVEFVLRCSLFEVYREQVRDLLDPANVGLRVRDAPQAGLYIEGLTHNL